MINHLKFINYAHDLASKNFGKTFPNPSVGCIITKKNKIISKGVTSSTGTPHAEEIALKKAGKKANGASMYVTREPCFHSSQNGSCADQILRSGIKENLKEPSTPKRTGTKPKNEKTLTNFGVFSMRLLTEKFWNFKGNRLFCCFNALKVNSVPTPKRFYYLID